MNSITYVFCMISFTLTTGTSVDYLEIDDFSQSETGTSCGKGLIAQEDDLTITAHISTNLITPHSWSVFDFQIYKKNETVAKSLCQFYFSETCTNAVEDRGCYCKQCNNETLEIILNKTAELDESEGEVFLKWRTLGSNTQRETRTVKLPVIHGEMEMHLYVGEKEVKRSRYGCEALFRPGDVLRWCVKNLERHTLKLNFHYGESNSTDDCIEEEITAEMADEVHFHFSFEEHEGCQRQKKYFCYIERIPRFSIWDYAVMGALLFGCSSRFLGPFLLEYLGFTKAGIRKQSKAAGFKRWIMRHNDVLLPVLSYLQRSGHRGTFDLPFCALCTIIGFKMGLMFAVFKYIIASLILISYITGIIVVKNAIERFFRSWF